LNHSGSAQALAGQHRRPENAALENAAGEQQMESAAAQQADRPLAASY